MVGTPWVSGARAAASRGGAVRTRVLRLGHHHSGAFPQARDIAAVLPLQCLVRRAWSEVWAIAHPPHLIVQRLLYGERVVREPRDAHGQGCLGFGEIMIGTSDDYHCFEVH